MSALALALAAAIGARAADIEPAFEDQKSSLDAQKRMHVEAVADLNAPLAKVFDAMQKPEKVAKYDPQITSAKVISQSAHGKVVEYKGQTIPVPNAPPNLQVKYTFDPGRKVVTAQSYGKTPFDFHADFALKPSKDGKGTVVNYKSVSGADSKALGFDPPEFMRRQAALNALMGTLRNVGQYIQNDGK
jgi:carbon monoxide dehydrogenase subunit G